ncbi:OmpA family protein [Paraburkholderia kururiensis]|uniref:OmpA family protein n=1 Tax=Paraburkholderia kururiensis TaxID=984307 RepID=UPI000F8666B8|nr:OmpA family protein [Paraburkholderia kururiensis]
MEKKAVKRKQAGRAAGVVLVAALAGCGTSQGPAYNAYTVGLPNGQRAYQVTCHGLLEGQDTCYSKAREICGSQAVQPLEQVAPLADADATRDVRILTFQCAAKPQPAPAPVVVPPPPPPPPAPPPQKVSLEGDTNFDVDRATLKPEARGRLDALIAAAGGVTFGTVTVNGYTDSTGTAAHNQGLSERRAQAVAQYLQEHGLKARQYVVHGYGESNPVADNATAEGRAHNRRVEITTDAVVQQKQQ